MITGELLLQALPCAALRIASGMREGGNRLKWDPSQAKAQRPAYQKKLDARAKLPGGMDAPAYSHAQPNLTVQPDTVIRPTPGFSSVMCMRLCTFLPAPLATAAAGASARCRRHSRQAEKNPLANVPKAPLPGTAQRATHVSARAQRSAGRHARRTRSLVFVPLLAAAKARAAIIDMIERNQERPLRLNPKP